MNKRELENLEAHYLSQVMCLERRLQDHRDLLREIVAYARECGHDWLSLHEADALLAACAPSIAAPLPLRVRDAGNAHGHGKRPGAGKRVFSGHSTLGENRLSAGHKDAQRGR